MRRTQITLTDEQYSLLVQESARTGASLAELIRRALDTHYGAYSDSERFALLDQAFGGWSDRAETGQQFVERVRSGTEGRLRRS